VTAAAKSAANRLAKLEGRLIEYIRQLMTAQVGSAERKMAGWMVSRGATHLAPQENSHAAVAPTDLIGITVGAGFPGVDSGSVISVQEQALWRTSHLIRRTSGKLIELWVMDQWHTGVIMA
jgi:hypothetical protein